MKQRILQSCLPLISVVMVVIFFSGCSTTRTSGRATSENLQAIPSRVQKGISTKEDVRTMLGEAKRREIYPTGERWLYGSAANQTTVAGAVSDQVISKGISMIPYAGSAINSLRSISRVGRSQKPGATIDFDQRGVVQNYAVQVQ